jgi:hypothetical protein
MLPIEVSTTYFSSKMVVFRPSVYVPMVTFIQVLSGKKRRRWPGLPDESRIRMSVGFNICKQSRGNLKIISDVVYREKKFPET